MTLGARIGTFGCKRWLGNATATVAIATGSRPRISAITLTRAPAKAR